jgi:hypothetical protein
MVLFLSIGNWKGLTYIRSKENKTRTIGIIACSIVVLSTVVTIWATVVSTKKILQSSNQNINSLLDAGE